MSTRKIVAASLLSVGLMWHSAVAEPPGPAPTLKVGDAAPPLTVGKWVKGTPVAKLEAGKVYVVEFWATWCAPCRAAMPHLSELSKKYADVTFIGQNVFEDDEADVAPFVKLMGDQLAYPVATDDKTKQTEGAMSLAWMKASGHDDIPQTFVVDKSGKIAWIGHPAELEPVLAKVVKGTYDPRAEAADKETLKALQRRIALAIKAGDIDGVLKATKQGTALKPEWAESFKALEFDVLIHNGRPDDARPRAEALATTAKNPSVLGSVAWMIATTPTSTPADLQTARRAVDRAIELSEGKDADLFDTAARVSAAAKDWPKASDLQKQALALADSQQKPDLQKSLDAYQKQQLPPAE